MLYFKSDINGDGAVGAFDLIDFLSVYNSFNTLGGFMDPNVSVLGDAVAIPSAQAKSRSNQPKPKPTTEFKSSFDAVTYLIAQGSMTVGEYLQLSSFLRQDVTLNLNQSGNVSSFDLMEFLPVFGMVTENSEPAFLPSNQGGLPIGVSAQETINWLIDDGNMTIGEYFNLAQYVRVECKADSDQSNSITTVDLLNFISVFDGPQLGEQGYDVDDPAFQF
jgi:hypothetical protein